MKFLIADSGSTKTDWALASEGQIIERVKTQGINPYHQSVDAIRRVLETELADVLRAENVDAVYFYGSGCRADQEAKMVRLLKERFHCAQTIEAHGDLLGAARALCGRGEGIACILGTGANSCYYDGEKILLNTPPLGYILGDEGSGAVLGRNFINGLFKGRLPKELCDDFMAEYNLTLNEIIRRVYQEPMANRWMASFTLYIYKHLNCPEVEQLVVDNFRSFFRLNINPYGRRELKVSALGSIAYYFREQLVKASHSEGYEIDRVLQNPIDGLLFFHNSPAFVDVLFTK